MDKQDNMDKQGNVNQIYLVARRYGTTIFIDGGRLKLLSCFSWSPHRETENKFETPFYLYLATKEKEEDTVLWT
jgi:hypothetical protein